MANLQAAITTQLSRQVLHWTKAAARFEDLDDLAAPAAWHNLERYLGLSIRQHLEAAVSRLHREGELLQAAFTAAASPADLLTVRRELLHFRNRYTGVETTLVFFADAINTRTNPRTAGYLKACDILAYRSMAQLLDQLGKPTPSALSYFDKGLGAAVLRANLRLWDGTGVNPVAAIKLTHHNLLPTALIHEAGHQAAAVVGWNAELAAGLATGLSAAPDGVPGEWAGWASEIAADAFAFAHTGYAAVAALHDVLAAEDALVFRHAPGDPHPISYIRVLLGVEMCRRFYGSGPWDDLAQAWVQLYPLYNAPRATRALLEASVPLLPSIVRITLDEPMRAFAGRSLASLIHPERVKPETLLAMERRLGGALYTSMHWIWTESLRLLALAGLKIATTPDSKVDAYAQLEEWLLRLGGALQAA
uniref:Uncharacterized protein n=1 Tax=Desulfovibrio sp. U5L TaxID=596152 RepID=I2Q587_9BACT